MKIALVGPELEENLALRYIHAALAEAGHEPRIMDFHAAGQIPQLVDEIVAFGPRIVGMSMVFTARAQEYVKLADELRAAGYAGHITAGGHFASFHAQQLLGEATSLDSVLHGEGEEAMVDLAANLNAGTPANVRGMTWRDAGQVVDTPPRPPVDDLDTRAWPTRSSRFHTYLGLPIANMLSGRGCFANCHFCSINAWHKRTGGKRFRQRSVEDMTAEMAMLYHRCGVRIFNFHDDNFFLPRREDNIERFTAIKAALDRLGVGRIAIQVKARPDSVEPETLGLLREMGLFRVFLGVESNAVAGLKALGRGIRREQNHTALRLIKDAGLHVTFNLLMFEPDCTLGDLRENVEFMRQYEDVPLNFCRVEVYGGTAIERRLREQGRLIGDYFGYTYRITEPASQLAYELFREVFTPRNFHCDGTNLMGMSVDYHLQILRHFFPRAATPRLVARSKGLIRRLNRSNAELLDAICDFAAELACDSDVVADGEAMAPATVREEIERLSRRRERFDAAMTADMTAMIEEIRQAAARDQARPAARFGKAAGVAAAGVMLASLVASHGCERAPHPNEMAPAGAGGPTSRPSGGQKTGEAPAGESPTDEVTPAGGLTAEQPSMTFMQGPVIVDPLPPSITPRPTTTPTPKPTLTPVTLPVFTHTTEMIALPPTPRPTTKPATSTAPTSTPSTSPVPTPRPRPTILHPAPTEMPAPPMNPRATPTPPPATQKLVPVPPPSTLPTHFEERAPAPMEDK
ncbi:MAG: radical SAM protein [Phycisphaerae bacterium]